MNGSHLTENDRAWRGISLLARAERRAWRSGFNLGLLCGAVAIALGFFAGVWLR